MSAPVHLDYGPLVATLVTRGWDVTAHDEVVGRKEDVWGIWTIAIDHAGRVRFVSTKPASAERGRRLQRDKVRYRLLEEAHHTLTVTTKITTAELLEQVLDQLALFATGQDS
jgi:hypothetical protein